jgi:hypothetical protein
VAHNPANGRVCVTSYWSWTVMMYDAETLTVLGELTGFAEPAHLAVNPNVGSDGHLLLVTSSSDGGLNQFLLIPGG